MSGNQKPDPIGEYLDLRIEMIYGEHSEEEWNELNEQANAVRTQFTHQEMLEYNTQAQERTER